MSDYLETVRQALKLRTVASTEDSVRRSIAVVDLEPIVDAARRLVRLAETGPDYEAAVEMWEGLHGANGQSPKPTPLLAELIIDAALADYLTEEE